MLRLGFQGVELLTTGRLSVLVSFAQACPEQIAGDPFFAELASDSRYRALLARLGLPLQLC